MGGGQGRCLNEKMFCFSYIKKEERTGVFLEVAFFYRFRDKKKLTLNVRDAIIACNSSHS